MENLHLFDSFFEMYHQYIKKTVKIDEYLDWLNSLPTVYKVCYSQFGFNGTKEDNAFAWFCLENREWYLSDFIGHEEPNEFSDY